MPFGYIEKSSRLEVICDKLPPGLQVREPAYSTIGSKDDIKFGGGWKDGRQIVNIGANKGRIYSYILANSACQLYCLI